MVPIPTFQDVLEANKLLPDRPQSWACLLLKVSQSAKVRRPLVTPDAAVGILRVSVFEVVEKFKSLPAVPVAIKIFPVKPDKVVVVLKLGAVLIMVMVPVAEETEMPVPDARERTPLLFNVTLPVNAPPPTRPVPAIT